MAKLLDYAQIEYDSNSLRNRLYGDIYFNPQQGFAESEHVFIRGNRLAERFAALDRRTHFTIGETGFGSGMNCLLAADCFLKQAPDDCRLIYISCEKHPIPLEDLRRIHQNWENPERRTALYQQYPHCRHGFHWLHLHPRIDLLLLWGEANELLPELHGSVDAWFLDGFAPGKNADMWSPRIFQAIAAHSRFGSTIATFSVARQVRDGLNQVGFRLQKQSGFGRKREMLVGEFQSNHNSAPHWTRLAPPINPHNNVKIIGAGLAGMASAWALAKRGIAVEIYHSPQRPAASQVPIAVPFLQVGREDTPMRRFQLAAWRYNKGFFAQLSAQFPEQIFLYPQDIVLSAKDDAAAERHRQIAAARLFSPDEYRLEADRHLILHGSGTIDTPALLNILSHHPLIRLIEQDIDSKQLETWQNDSVIFAGAWHHDLLPQDWHRHLRPLRGQACIAGVTPHFEPAATCAHYSILPFADRQKIYIGSAYQPNCADGSIRYADNELLLKHFQDSYPQYTAHYDSAFAGVRASSRDYLPFIGPIPNPQALKQAYHKWQFDKHIPIRVNPEYPRAWYLHAGLGSKGCLTAFYGAELLAAMMLNSPLPIEESLISQLLPARALIRDIIRRQATN